MKVDIWSDIRCPFCYIGKRKFENALAQFPQKDKVEVTWHSFELDPDLKTDTTKNVYDYLAERKGQSREWALKMHEHVLQAAKEADLDFHFDKAVIANSFNAHRLIQVAKHYNLGDAAKEALFKAQFVEGKNIDDNDVLLETGALVGLSRDEIMEMLSSGAYAKEVREDEAIAHNRGISDVPFFVLNDKYGISGAQSPEVFLAAIQQSWTANEKEHPEITMGAIPGNTCVVTKPAVNN